MDIFDGHAGYAHAMIAAAITDAGSPPGCMGARGYRDCLRRLRENCVALIFPFAALMLYRLIWLSRDRDDSTCLHRWIRAMMIFFD